MINIYKDIIEPEMTKENHESERRKYKFDKIHAKNCPTIMNELYNSIKNVSKNGGTQDISIPLKGFPRVFFVENCEGYREILSSNKCNIGRNSEYVGMEQSNFYKLFGLFTFQKTVNLKISNERFYTHSSFRDSEVDKDFASKVKYYNIS